MSVFCFAGIQVSTQLFFAMGQLIVFCAQELGYLTPCLGQGVLLPVLFVRAFSCYVCLIMFYYLYVKESEVMVFRCQIYQS